MSYCPRPSKTSKTNYGNSATKTVSAPAPREEGCNPSSSTVVSGGGSSSQTEVYIPGPAGPKGDKGLNGLSWEFKGAWSSGAEYKTAKPDSEDNAERIYHVVTANGQTYVCIQDHTANGMNEPQLDSFIGPTDWESHWHIVAVKGNGALEPEEKSFFDTLGDIYDWVSNASVEELIGAGLAAVGVVVAGAAVVDMLTDDGAGDGEADQRFNGTLGYPVTSFTNPDIKEVVQSLCAIEGIPCDASALPDDECAFTIGSTPNIRNILGQLALAYMFEMVDTGGVLRFVPRSASSSKIMHMEDMGVDDVNSSGNMPETWQAKRLNGINLPRYVSVTYTSRDMDHNKFAQNASYVTFEDGQEVNVTIPFSLTHEKAKQIAELSLIQSHLEAQTYAFTTTYKYIDVEPGDVVDIYREGQLYTTVRITSIEEEKEGVLGFTAVDAGSVESLLSSNTQVVQPPASTNVPTVIGYSQALFVDPTNLDSGDNGIRVYAAVHGYDAPGWPGAQIYVSDNGTEYSAIATARSEATVGLVASPIAAASQYVWDETTEITVQLKTNTLVGVSADEVLNGKNLAMVGKEIIGFKNQTLIGPKTYKLTGLLRGRQGTEQHIGTHVANELFTLLDDSLIKLEFTPAERGKIKKYKVVTIGSSIDKVDAQDVQMFSNNTLPWPVYNGKVQKVGSDFIVSWKESARFNNQIRDLTGQQRDPNWGGYGIYIYNGSDVVKTYTTTSDTWTYTSVMQTADFGSAQSSLKVAVAQLDTVYGAGYSVTLNS